MCAQRQNVKAQKASAVCAGLETLTYCTEDLRQSTVLSPCPPSAPWYLSFYSVGRKSLSKAYFFFLPATLPPFTLESAAIILGQIVAMLSGACGTRQDSWNNWDIDHPQPWPWPLLHSCHYFNRSFESFQKCIQWKIFPFLSQGGLAEVEDFCL